MFMGLYSRHSGVMYVGLYIRGVIHQALQYVHGVIFEAQYSNFLSFAADWGGEGGYENEGLYTGRVMYEGLYIRHCSVCTWGYIRGTVFQIFVLAIGEGTTRPRAIYERLLYNTRELCPFRHSHSKRVYIICSFFLSTFLQYNHIF